MNTRIVHPDSKAQDTGDNKGMACRILCFVYDVLRAIYHMAYTIFRIWIRVLLCGVCGPCHPPPSERHASTPGCDFSGKSSGYEQKLNPEAPTSQKQVRFTYMEPQDEGHGYYIRTLVGPRLYCLYHERFYMVQHQYDEDCGFVYEDFENYVFDCLLLI